MDFSLDNPEDASIEQLSTALLRIAAELNQRGHECHERGHDEVADDLALARDHATDASSILNRVEDR